MSDEPKRPYYDKAAHQAALKQSEGKVAAALKALKKSLGFGVCVVIGTDGKKYPR